MYLLNYHAIEEHLRRAPGILYVTRSSQRIQKISGLARKHNVKVIHVTSQELTHLCAGQEHRGIALKIREQPAEKQRVGDLDLFIEGVTGGKALVLILDNITDPHNLGAILRSADLFAVDLVIIPSRRSAREGETVAAVSAGANAYVPVVRVSNLKQVLEKLKKADFWVYGARMEGQRIDRFDLTGRVAIVLGSEGKGLRPLVSETCDGFLSIPTQGHIDSLNVSVAAGILLYETRRQQG